MVFKGGVACPQSESVVAFVERRLTPSAAAALESHLAGCADCRRAVSDLAGSLATVELGALSATAEIDLKARAAPRPGDCVASRYRITAEIGAGAMGVVYAAHDLELNRQVALKLLRPQADAAHDSRDRQARLQREARALARLSHANVVVVYDVGRFQDQIFLTMELVEGRNLRTWFRERPRGWREVWDVFVRAGRGLSAAHQAGLVHRDFKPDNVLVGRDDQVRVSDFGVARSTLNCAPPEAFAGPTADDIRLTTTGLLVGTPAYMAPEQLGGRPASAASDQFSFCASFYEALYGERPFAGDDLASLAAAIQQGRPQEPSRRAAVPGWLRRILVRGLSARPVDRYPTMDHLLAELERVPRRSRRRLQIALAAVALAAASTLGFFTARPRPSPLCQTTSRKLARIWNDSRRQATHKAFQATGLSYAEGAWQAATRTLDAYVADWRATQAQVCATARGELDPRLDCLDDRVRDLDAVVSLFEAPDRETAGRAGEAAARLQGARGCAQETVRRQAVLPAHRDDIEAARAGLARVRALASAGRYAYAARESAATLEKARKVGERTLEARALVMLGNTQRLLGHAKAAEQTLLEGVRAAEATRQDELAARALVILAFVVGCDQHRYDQGLQWGALASAAIERAGGNLEITASLHTFEGLLFDEQGKYDRAVERFDQALAETERAMGPSHPDLAALLNNVSSTQYKRGRYAEAGQATERALLIQKRMLGEGHPDLARSLGLLGDIADQQGKHEQALERYASGLAIAEAAQGPDHPDIAIALSAVGGALIHMGRLDEAFAREQRALSMFERLKGPDHPEVATVLRTLGHVRLEQRRFDEARSYYQRALAILEHAYGPQHPKVAVCLENLGVIATEWNRPREALSYYQRALEMMEKTLGSSHPYVAYALVGVGQSQVALGRPDRALAPLERGLTLVPQDASAPDLAGNCRFALADALWRTGGDRARSRSLALAAQDDLKRAGPTEQRALARVERWLAAHPR